jgi:hypothetical protein
MRTQRRLLHDPLLNVHLDRKIALKRLDKSPFWRNVLPALIGGRETTVDGIAHKAWTRFPAGGPMIPL